MERPRAETAIQAETSNRPEGHAHAWAVVDGGRDPSDPGVRAAELAQRGRIVLDVATADFEASERLLGPFHPTTWYFREALAEARKAWDRLRAEFGPKGLDGALLGPPRAVLSLGVGGGEGEGGSVLLIPIDGRTFRAEAVPGTPLAPVQWRLTRLSPPLEHGPYYACLLRDGSTQCDCAEWTYRPDEPGTSPAAPPCKHLAALASLGWLGPVTDPRRGGICPSGDV